MFGPNVSVRCTLHGCSKVKGRAKVSNGQLATWLQRGVNECGVSEDAPVAKQKVRHTAMFTY